MIPATQEMKERSHVISSEIKEKAEADPRFQRLITAVNSTIRSFLISMHSMKVGIHFYGMDPLRMQRILNGPVHITIGRKRIPIVVINEFKFGDYETSLANVLERLPPKYTDDVLRAMHGINEWEIGPSEREPLDYPLQKLVMLIESFVHYSILEKLARPKIDSNVTDCLLPPVVSTRIIVRIYEAEESSLSFCPKGAGF